MRLPIPPSNPITEQFLGEENVRWQERDEAAKREQKLIQERNAMYRSLGNERAARTGLEELASAR